MVKTIKTNKHYVTFLRIDGGTYLLFGRVICLGSSDGSLMGSTDCLIESAIGFSCGLANGGKYLPVAGP